MFFCLVCVRMCLFKWSLRMNFLLHSGHSKRFSPVWVRRCRCNSSERVNRLPQNTHEHSNGRSPVMRRKFALILVLNIGILVWFWVFTNRCAIANGPEDVMFCHRLCCNRQCDRCAVACDRRAVHLRYSLGMCMRLVSSVASQHRLHLHSSLWWWSSFAEWLSPLWPFDWQRAKQRSPLEAVALVMSTYWPSHCLWSISLAAPAWYAAPFVVLMLSFA